MKAKEYLEEQKFGYDHFTELTSTGINPDNNNIAQFAEDYHQAKLNELTIRGVSGSSFTKDDLKKAFNSGRTLKNYKGEWVDNELMMDDHTDGKYSDFEDWFENYR